MSRYAIATYEIGRHGTGATGATGPTGPAGTGYQAKTAATALADGDVVKTVGTQLVVPGSFVLAGADTDGDLLLTEKDTSAIYTVTTEVGGALGFTIVGLVITLTVTVTTTGTAAAAYFIAQPTIFAKFNCQALGTGASVCVQASGPTGAANGRLTITALIRGLTFAAIVPASASATLSSSYVAPAITISSATDTKKKPTTTGTLAAVELAALAAANPGVFSVSAEGTGALPIGALAATAMQSGGVSLATGGASGDGAGASGIAHPAALITALANIYGSGSRCPIAGVPIGPVFRSNTGTLVAYGSLVVGEYSTRMGLSDGAGVDVLIGEEFQVI